MPSHADHPQRKPSIPQTAERTIRQRQHDRETRIVREGFGLSTLEYLFAHPDSDNSTRMIAEAIGCSKTTVENLVKEYVETGQYSTIGITAACHGFLVRKVKKGAYWRLEVDPHRVPPAFLDPASCGPRDYFDPSPLSTIEDLADFFKPLTLPGPGTRPDLKGLRTDQDDTSSPYLRWLEEDGGEE